MSEAGGTELYGISARLVREACDSIEYEIECNTQNGTMKFFHLFPGIDYAITAFSAFSCMPRRRSFPDVIEFAFCKSGRFECEYEGSFFTYVGEGDFAICPLHAQLAASSFPLRCYEGFAIIVDLKYVGTVLEYVIEDLTIDFQFLLHKFCPYNRCAVIKPVSALQRVCYELYDCSKKQNRGYMRLKVLELFFLLMQWMPKENTATTVYFAGVYIKKIKAIKAYITEHLDERLSLNELAQKYNISLTMMKNCFKAVYGKPINRFQREYKMQKAGQLLKNTNYSILEIAGRMGFENPSKFSSAFKEIIGCSPREYRQNCK